MTRSAGHRLDRPGFGKARGACPSLAELVVGKKDTPGFFIVRTSDFALQSYRAEPGSL